MAEKTGNYKLWKQGKSVLAVKTLMSFYIIYNFALTDMGFFIPRLSIMVLMTSLLITMFSSDLRLPFGKCPALVYSFIFIAVCLLFGLLIAKDTSLVVSGGLRYVESLVVGYIIICCVYRSRSVDFVAFSLAVASLLVARFMISYADTIVVTGRISVNEDVNANTIAVMLAFGCWGLGYMASRIKNVPISLIIMTVGTLILLMAQFLTGSRKGLLGTVFFVLAWLVLNFGGRVRRMGFGKKSIIFIFATVFIVWIIGKYGGMILERSALTMSRMEELDSAVGEGGWKWGMIADAFRVFSEHPLFGVGFDNNRYYSIYKMYAHNSYAEAFASTGIFGVVFLGLMYYYIIRWHYYACRHFGRLPYTKADIYYSTVFLLEFLFICFGQICFYNGRLMLIFYTLIGYSFLFESSTKEFRYKKMTAYRTETQALRAVR